MFHKLKTERTVDSQSSKQAAIVSVQDPEWTELLGELVVDTQVYWKSQTWMKKVPSGIESIAAYYDVYKQVTLHLQKADDHLLVESRDVLKQCIQLVLTDKAAKKTASNSYMLLLDDSKAASLDFKKTSRKDVVAQFYENLHKMLNGDKEQQRDAKKQLLQIREKIWGKNWPVSLNGDIRVLNDLKK